MSKYRLGVIGRTGRGDYGHYLDQAFQDLPAVECVAVADNDTEGLQAAAKRLGTRNLYRDFRRMLEEESLDLVSVGPRWTDCHADMVIACAGAGVKGILCEKPFSSTLAEADAMIEACERNKVRIAVAHRRACAHEQYAKKLVDAGEIGPIQTMRGHGKADHRAGAMDLMVLGTHILDSMRYFASSDVVWASGHVTHNGQEVASKNIREETEGVGLVAGNGVSAYYVFKNGITAHYESHRGDRPGSRWFGFEIYGLNGIISLRGSPCGEMYRYPHGLWIPGEEDGRWERVFIDEWERHPDGTPRTESEQMHLSNRMIAEELIQAIEEDREVLNCSNGRDGRAALEMIMAVHESQRVKARVNFPLKTRQNPYKVLLGEMETPG
jgi:predicted dehydrogenase